LGSKDCDLTCPDSLERFSTVAYDRIYHLATWTQAGDFCLHHPGEQWIRNQQINTNVLAWWQRCQPQAKLIAMGTSCAYDPAFPLTEENYLCGVPIDSLFAYGMTKRMLYAGLLSLHRQYGLNYLYLIPSTLYGPDYHLDGRQMHFIFDLVRKVLAGKLYGSPVVLWGDGYQCRELVYVEDFVTVMLALADDRDNDILNVGAGEEFPIRHFAQIICDLAGYDFGELEFDASRYVGAKSKCLSTEKLGDLLPGEWRVTSLEEGLGRTVAWFRAHPESFAPTGAGPG
jgi:GDP-L-fucose synthase